MSVGMPQNWAQIRGGRGFRASSLLHHVTGASTEPPVPEVLQKKPCWGLLPPGQAGNGEL